MKIARKEYLISILAIVFLGLLSSLPATGARKTRKASQMDKNIDLYLVQGAETFSLQPGDLSFKTVLAVGSNKSGLYGIPSPPNIRLDIEPFALLIFDPDTAGATLELTKLAHLETAPAHSFDLKPVRVGPALFKQVYGVDYDALIPINLWCVERAIPLNLMAVAGKPGWYRAVPIPDLEGGVYAVNFGGAGGPRIYRGNVSFYPFRLAEAPGPAPAVREPGH
jgi:hypothetical protein